MAVTNNQIQINNEQISNANPSDLTLGIDGSQKLQDNSVTSNKLANDIVIGNSLTVTTALTAATLAGEGGNISNIQGANVVGAVALANTATHGSIVLSW